jgi:hypothetical protein
VCVLAPPRPHRRFGCLQAGSSRPSAQSPRTHCAALAPRTCCAAPGPDPAALAAMHKHNRTAATRAAQPGPAARTSEIKRHQTRWQCARQRRHTRIPDIVGCKPRAADLITLRCALLARTRSSHMLRRARSEPSCPCRNARTQQLAQPPRRTPAQRHIPRKLSAVRLGGSERASASAPASPIRLAASREQPTLRTSPCVIARHSLLALLAPRPVRTQLPMPQCTHAYNNSPTHCAAQPGPADTYRRG